MRQAILPGFKQASCSSVLASEVLPLCEQGKLCEPGGCDECNGTRHRLSQDITARSGEGFKEGDPVQQVLFH